MDKSVARDVSVSSVAASFVCSIKAKPIHGLPGQTNDYYSALGKCKLKNNRGDGAQEERIREGNQFLPSVE